MIPDLQRVLEPSYLSGIADAPIEQIRSMRAECSDLENGASFVRRLAQGRLDLLAEETKRRADGGGGGIALANAGSSTTLATLRALGDVVRRHVNSFTKSSSSEAATLISVRLACVR